jgi:hypothetical protein
MKGYRVSSGRVFLPRHSPFLMDMTLDVSQTAEKTGFGLDPTIEKKIAGLTISGKGKNNIRFIV